MEPRPAPPGAARIAAARASAGAQPRRSTRGGRIPAAREGSPEPARPKAGPGARGPDAPPPRASRTLTLLTAAAAMSLGWMILSDHVAPNLRTRSEPGVQAAGDQPEAALGAAPAVPSSRRTPLLTGEAARRALAAEAREDVRRRFQQPAFAPGEEPAL